MKNHTLLTFLLLIPFLLSAQYGTPPVGGAMGIGMGYTGVTNQNVFSSLTNQAGLAFVSNFSAAVQAEQRFLLSETNIVTAAAAIPLKKAGSFGANLNYYGYDSYNEMRIGLGYARQLVENWSLGAQFNYFNISIPEYGNRAIYTFELGVQALLIEKLVIGAHIFSPIRVEITELDRMPTIFSFGGSYRFSEKFFLAMELEQDTDFATNFKTGLEYRIAKPISVRAGIQTQPVLNTFGIGIHLNKIQIDLATTYHQTLGFTPGVSVAYGL